MTETKVELDGHWMERALRLAQQSVGLASPNPAVGCVLLHGEQVVGEGFHAYDQRDHAEIVALKQAGVRAQGATAYVTLEPCSHHGRTGPCADALLAAGVARVVVATVDPNPLVSGAGIARLRAAGVPVDIGVLQQAARELNDGFARHIASGLPLVTMKVAATLDGRIGRAQQAAGVTYWITGDQARAEVHRMRHAADALMIGVGTILADDPLLTDRSGQPRRRPLLRIVLDSTLRTPLDSQLVRTAREDVVLFFNHASAASQQALIERGVRLLQVPRDSEGLQLPEVLQSMHAMQLTNLMVEGGAKLYTSLLNQDLVDKLVLFYAPAFLGQAGLPMLGSVAAGAPIKRYALKQFGEDFAVEAYLRDPWEMA